MKYITFVLDSFELYKDYFFGDETFCHSYFDTDAAIDNRLWNIWTYDIGHLSFDLNNIGYKITIVYNGRFLHISEGMSTANGKEIRFSHNLRRLLIGGAFDNDLGINKKRFYVPDHDSTHELMEREKNMHYE